MAEKLLMKGNEALAEAAIRAGCVRFFGYPITPQTELAAYMSKKLPKIENGVYMQAESEIAAVNMLYGAAASGVRAMTSSSSPGISLKTEGISYLCGSDLPCLIVNVMRAGPGLGGIQPGQADYWQATRAPGHGDAHVIALAPSSIQEIVDLVFDGFELSEKYRVPVMILSDGLLGQMMEPVSFPERDPNEAEKPWALTGTENKREHNIVNSLYLDPAALEEKNIERFSRYAEIKKSETRADYYLMDDAEYAIVAYGAMARVAGSAVDLARAKGIKVGLIHPITLWPFPVKEVNQYVGQVKEMLVVEMSMGQMIEDVVLATQSKLPVQFFGHAGGIIPTPAEIADKLVEMAGGK